MFYLDILKYLVKPEYYPGLKVIPIVMLGELFFGIYFNLSLWYKLTDRTMIGAYLGIFGSIVSILMNVLLIPILGYWASALSILVCFALMSLISYLMGQKHFKIPYDLKRFAFYLGISLFFYFIYWKLRTETNPQFVLAFLLNVLFLLIVIRVEKKEFKELFQKNKN